MSATELYLSVTSLVRVVDPDISDEGLPYGPDFVIAGVTYCGSRGGLGHSVSFEQGNVQLLEEVQNVGVDWGCPCDGVLQIGEPYLLLCLLPYYPLQNGNAQPLHFTSEAGN